MDKPKIIIITGPTATGKTALAVLVAKSSGGEIVSADSMQIYKHMDIGTAKPTDDERQGVPHHMIDIVMPWEDYSVARYVEEAERCVNDIHERGKLPILVGGTGLYIDSLVYGRKFTNRGDESVRRELEAEYDVIGGEAMLHKLHGFDPESSAKLHSNDKKRIVRAFEAYMTTGKTISQHNAETKSLPARYDVQKFALMLSDRAELYSKIDRRVDIMLDRGLFGEVRNLIDMGVPPDCTAMQAIGYKEMVPAVLGKCSMDFAADRIKMESRRYAKRQLTWLRRDSDVTWIMLEEDEGIAVIRKTGAIPDL